MKLFLEGLQLKEKVQRVGQKKIIKQINNKTKGNLWRGYFHFQHPIAKEMLTYYCSLGHAQI